MSERWLLRFYSLCLVKDALSTPTPFVSLQICSQTKDSPFWKFKSLSSLSEVTFLYRKRVWGGTHQTKGSKESSAPWKCLQEGPYCSSYWLCEMGNCWEKKGTLWAASSWIQGFFSRRMPAIFLRYDSADRCQCCQLFTQCSEKFVFLERPLAICTDFTASSLGHAFCDRASLTSCAS